MKSLSPLKEIGAMPKPGYSNPRFWSPSKNTPDIPQGGFQSIIGTARPLDDAEVNRIMKVATGPNAVYGKVGGSGSASTDAMRDAFAQMSSNALGSAQDEFQTKYQSQAQKSQAEDILGQKQSATDRFRMELGAESFGRDTWQRLQQGYKDLAQYAMEEQKNASARFWASFLGSL